jgi:hypothetical protein
LPTIFLEPRCEAARARSGIPTRSAPPPSPMRNDKGSIARAGGVPPEPWYNPAAVCTIPTMINIKSATSKVLANLEIFIFIISFTNHSYKVSYPSPLD